MICTILIIFNYTVLKDLHCTSLHVISVINIFIDLKDLLTLQLFCTTSYTKFILDIRRISLTVCNELL